MTEARHKAPATLGKAGKTLWSAVVADLAKGLEFDARELELLRRACRCADELDLLEAAIDEHGAMIDGSRGQRVVNPALTEARQLRLTMLRLLSSIELVDTTRRERSTKPASVRARKAAHKRWDYAQRGHRG